MYPVNKLYYISHNKSAFKEMQRGRRVTGEMIKILNTCMQVLQRPVARPLVRSHAGNYSLHTSIQHKVKPWEST